MTYQELQDRILAYLGHIPDPDPSVLAALPSFIEQAEDRIYRELRDQRMARNVFVLDLGSGTLPPFVLPDDFLGNGGVFDGATEWEQVPIAVLLDKDACQGAAQRYAINANELVIQDNAANPTTVLNYYAKPARLSAATTANNQIFQQNPDMFLYGALAEASIFMRDPNNGAMWNQQFLARLAALRMEQWNAKWAELTPQKIRLSR